MTEYELATLTLLEWELWAAFGQLAASVIIGLGQIAVVWLGIRSYEKEDNLRHEKVMNDLRSRRNEAANAHNESMTALRELIDAQRADRQALLELIARTSRTNPA